MDKLDLSIIVTIADVQRAGLIVSTVGSAGHFTIFTFVTTAWHPSFDVELSVGWSSKVTCGCVNDSVWKTKSLEDLLFNGENLLVVAFAFLWKTVDEHLKL